MSPPMTLQPGATNSLSIVVDESMTAERFGNSEPSSRGRARWGPAERVGEGSHERFIVDMGRFMERIAAKTG